MVGAITRDILNRRPRIDFVAPKSGITIPDSVPVTDAPTPKEDRINQLINGLEKASAVADAIENVIAARAKNEVLKLDLKNPEDAVVAQAAGRHFPDRAINIGGFIHVPEITFDMYHQCIKSLKANGLEVGTKNQTKSNNFKADKTNFGGTDKDHRPAVNKASIPFAPLDIPAFIAAGIPILFTMLFPLIEANNKKDIIGHLHPTITPAGPAPSGPGIPLV